MRQAVLVAQTRVAKDPPDFWWAFWFLGGYLVGYLNKARTAKKLQRMRL